MQNLSPVVGWQGGELKEQAYSHVIGLYECRGLLSMAFPGTVSNLCGEGIGMYSYKVSFRSF